VNQEIRKLAHIQFSPDDMITFRRIFAPVTPTRNSEEPNIIANFDAMKMQTANGLLAEIFWARPEDIDLIQSRPIARTWR